MFFILFMTPPIVKGESTMDKSITIVVEGKDIILCIANTNLSNEILYVYPIMPAISVLDDKDRELDFIGVQVKSRPLHLADYIRLEPGKTHVQKFTLNSLYKFRHDKAYKVRMAGGYFDPEKGNHVEKPLIVANFKFPAK